MKKIISTIFDITFINLHFKKKYSVEQAKITAYKNTSGLISFLFIMLVINFAIIIIALFKVEISKLYFYILLLPIASLIYFITKKKLKPNIDFSIEKYTEEYIKNNKKRNYIFILIFGLVGGLSYVILKLLLLFRDF